MAIWSTTQPAESTTIPNVPTVVTENFKAIKDWVRTGHYLWSKGTYASSSESGHHLEGYVDSVFVGTAAEIGELGQNPMSGALAYNTDDGILYMWDDIAAGGTPRGASDWIPFGYISKSQSRPTSAYSWVDAYMGLAASTTSAIDDGFSCVQFSASSIPSCAAGAYYEYNLETAGYATFTALSTGTYLFAAQIGINHSEATSCGYQFAVQVTAVSTGVTAIYPSNFVQFYHRPNGALSTINLSSSFSFQQIVPLIDGDKAAIVVKRGTAHEGTLTSSLYGDTVQSNSPTKLNIIRIGPPCL